MVKEKVKRDRPYSIQTNPPYFLMVGLHWEKEKLIKREELLDEELKRLRENIRQLHNSISDYLSELRHNDITEKFNIWHSESIESILKCIEIKRQFINQIKKAKQTIKVLLKGDLK